MEESERTKISVRIKKKPMYCDVDQDATQTHTQKMQIIENTTSKHLSESKLQNI